MFFSKSFILDVRLRSEYASGTVNYFRQKLHLKIYNRILNTLLPVLSLLNEIGKACYKETKKNGNKHVPLVSRNSSSKIFVIFLFWMVNYQLVGLYEHSYL